MDSFRHVLTLFAFVFAVALTQLLSRLGTIFVARERVKFSPFYCLTTTLAIIVI